MKDINAEEYNELLNSDSPVVLVFRREKLHQKTY